MGWVPALKELLDECKYKQFFLLPIYIKGSVASEFKATINLVQYFILKVLLSSIV